MRVVVRFAMAIAFSRDRRQRWRQVSVVSGSAIATVVLLLAVSLVGAALSAQDRAVSRQAPPAVRAEALGAGAAVPEGAVAKEVTRTTLVDGRQVPTKWIQPLSGHENDPDAVPRGLSRALAPGEAVLSPRLVSDGVRAEDLGWNSSDAGAGPGGAIGQNGLSMASDLVVYVRPGVGVDLGTEGAVSYVFSYRESDPMATSGLALDPEVLAVDVMLYGAFVFLFMPGMILLVSSSRARSPVRDGRLHFLHILGARQGSARLTMGIENGSLGFVGALAGAVLYGIFGYFFTAIPLTSIRFFPGDLGMSRWAALAVGSFVTMIATLCGAIGRMKPKAPSRAGSWVPRLFLIVFVLSVGVVIASALPAFRGSGASTAFVIGSLFCIASIPFAIPRVMVLVAVSLSSVRSAVLWAAARRLQHDAVHLTRMASILSVLVVVSSLAVSMWGASSATQAERSTTGSETLLSLDWRGPDETLVPVAQSALDEAGLEALVLPLSFEGEGDPGVVRIPDCRAFAVLVEMEPLSLCDGDAEGALQEVVRERTGHSMMDPGEVSTRDPIGPRVIVLSSRKIENSEIQQALGFLPAFNLQTRPGEVSAPLPLLQWIVAGGAAAFLILAFAVSRELGDRTVEDRERELIYRQLGLSSDARTRLTWCLFLLPALVATVVAFVCATVLAYAGSVHRITEGDVSKVGAVSVIALLILLATVAVAMVLRRAADAFVETRAP